MRVTIITSILRGRQDNGLYVILNLIVLKVKSFLHFKIFNTAKYSC